MLHALLLFAILAGSEEPAVATEPEACVQTHNDSRLRSGSIGLIREGGRARWIRGAIQAWKQCENYGRDFPEFVADGPGDQTIRVVFKNGSSGDRRCAEFRGREVRIYRFATRASGERVSCGFRHLNLAHELGHVLGLRDIPRGQQCKGIMTRLDEQNRFHRQVSPGECRAVGERWLTLAEMPAHQEIAPEATTTGNVSVSEDELERELEL